MKTAQEYYNIGLANEDSQHFESAIKLDTEYRDNFKELREICKLIQKIKKLC